MRLRSRQELNWFSTVRGRLGYLAWDRIAVYATAGLAFGGVEDTAMIDAPRDGIGIASEPAVYCEGSGVVCMKGSESKVQLGWTLGGGVEVPLTRSISFKAEYLHIDLGSETVTLKTTTPYPAALPQYAGMLGTATTSARFDNTYDVVRAGLNVRF